MFVWAPFASRLCDYFAHRLAQTSSPESNFSGLIVINSGLVSGHSSLLQTHVFTKWLVSLVYTNRENKISQDYKNGCKMLPKLVQIVVIAAFRLGPLSM